MMKSAQSIDGSVSANISRRNSEVSNSSTFKFRRSQTVSWNSELTATWQEETADETAEERASRYISYLCPSENQLKSVRDRMMTQIKNRLDSAVIGGSSKTISDSLVKVLGRQYATDGVAYAVELGSTEIVAVRLTKDGDDIHADEVHHKLKSEKQNLTSPTTTAFELFDVMAETISKLPINTESKDEVHKVAFVCGFDVQIWSSNSMYLLNWSSGVETGRETEDSVEQSDIAAMLQCAFLRRKMPFKVSACLNNQSATAILGLAQLQGVAEDGDVRFTADLGTGFSVGAIVSKPEYLKLTGEVVDMNLGQFNNNIPIADFDLEVDWADGNVGMYPLAKMVSGTYLGEVARRVVIKVLEDVAPQIAWCRGSLPTHVCSRIVGDQTVDVSVGRECLRILWDWADITVEQAKLIRRICKAVYIRSASLASASIVASIMSQNGLQPALGSSIVAVTGSLFRQSPFYQSMVKKHIDMILGPLLSRLIVLAPTKGGSAVGAALYLLSNDP